MATLGLHAQSSTSRRLILYSVLLSEGKPGVVLSGISELVSVHHQVACEYSIQIGIWWLKPKLGDTSATLSTRTRGPEPLAGGNIL